MFLGTCLPESALSISHTHTNVGIPVPSIIAMIPLQVLITAFAYLFQGVVSFLLWLGFLVVAFLEEVVKLMGRHQTASVRKR